MIMMDELCIDSIEIRTNNVLYGLNIQSKNFSHWFNWCFLFGEHPGEFPHNESCQVFKATWQTQNVNEDAMVMGRSNCRFYFRI